MAIRNAGDRKYIIVIHLGYDNGTRKTKSKTVDLSHLSKRAAEKEIILIEKEFELEVKGCAIKASGITLRRFVENVWLKDYAEKNLRPKTIFSYAAELNNRILPELGYLKLNEITPVHLMRFYNKVSQQTYSRGKSLKQIPLSNRTIKYQHQILSSVLGKATDWQFIKENPCRYVSPPKVRIEKPQMKYMDIEEAITFLIAIEDEPLKYVSAVELAVLGGLRTEEILGLDVNDILDDGVYIRRTSTLVGFKGMVVEDITKTPKSLRVVTLPQSVINHLKKLSVYQKTQRFKLQNIWNTEKYSGTLLFTQDDGSPMYGTTLNSWMKKFIKKYNTTNKDQLPPISFHGLRHTNAALMVYLGVDVQVGASRMGHAKTSTFLNMYGGKTKRADEEITQKLSNLFSVDN